MFEFLYVLTIYGKFGGWVGPEGPLTEFFSIGSCIFFLRPPWVAARRKCAYEDDPCRATIKSDAVSGGGIPNLHQPPTFGQKWSCTCSNRTGV